MRKIPETISEEELVKLVNNTPKKHHKAAFLLAFYQGLRVSEVVNLTKENVKLKQHYIEIKQAKGKKDRHIPIVKPLLLSEQTVARATKHLPIKCGVRSLQEAFKTRAKKILKRDLKFHTLRHSNATWLINDKGWDVSQVQQFLGHSKLSTTEIYLHTTPKQLIRLEWGEE